MFPLPVSPGTLGLPAPVACVVLLAGGARGVGALSQAVMKDTNDAFNVPGTESQRASDLLDEKSPGAGGATASAGVRRSRGASRCPRRADIDISSPVILCVSTGYSVVATRFSFD